MMAIHNVYIDSSFWRNNEGDCIVSSIAFLEKCLLSHYAYYKLHFNQIQENIDDIYKDVAEGINTAPLPPIDSLLLQLSNGGSANDLIIENDTDYDTSFFQRLKIEEYFGTIIFVKPGKCDGVSQEKGFLVVSNDSLQLMQVKTLSKDEIVQDTNFTSTIIPCNSIVVADRYILKDERTIDINLLPILKKMKSNVHPIHLTILAQFTYNDGRSHISIDKAFQLLKDKLGSYGDWKIDVYNTEQKIHDRMIITNNSYITIGAGFDCRVGSGSQLRVGTMTTMHTYIMPLLQNVISEEVQFYINEINKAISGLDYTKKKSNFSTNDKNRLLKFQEQ